MNKHATSGQPVAAVELRGMAPPQPHPPHGAPMHAPPPPQVMGGYGAGAGPMAAPVPVALPPPEMHNASAPAWDDMPAAGAGAGVPVYQYVQERMPDRYSFQLRRHACTLCGGGRRFSLNAAVPGGGKVRVATGTMARRCGACNIAMHCAKDVTSRAESVFGAVCTPFVRTSATCAFLGDCLCPVRLKVERPDGGRLAKYTIPSRPCAPDVVVRDHEREVIGDVETMGCLTALCWCSGTRDVVTLNDKRGAAASFSIRKTKTCCGGCPCCKCNCALCCLPCKMVAGLLQCILCCRCTVEEATTHTVTTRDAAHVPVANITHVTRHVRLMPCCVCKEKVAVVASPSLDAVQQRMMLAGAIFVWKEGGMVE